MDTDLSRSGPGTEPAPSRPGVDAGPGDAGTPTTPDGSLDGGIDAEVDAGACAPRDTDTAPKAASFPVTLAGQAAWIHDEKSPAGYFHTFDTLAVGPNPVPRKVHVFLPRTYGTSGCKRYPVLYFNDGDTTFFPGGAGNKSWDVADVLTKAYAASTFGEVIVVAVHPLEREREYTHAPWLGGHACCGLPAYTSYLADAVKPFIDGAYRTKSGPADTVIVGSSHGGLAAFWIATSRPLVFGKAIAMSSSFWAGLDEVFVGGPLATSSLLAAAGPGLTTGKPRLYMDWGLVRTGGTHNAIIEARATARSIEMRDLLVANYGYVAGKTLFTTEDPQGEHDENSWHRRLGHALAVVLGP